MTSLPFLSNHFPLWRPLLSTVPTLVHRCATERLRPAVVERPRPLDATARSAAVKSSASSLRRRAPEATGGVVRPMVLVASGVHESPLAFWRRDSSRKPLCLRPPQRLLR